MTQQEIEGKLIQVISTITNQDASVIAPDKPFHELGIAHPRALDAVDPATAFRDMW